MQTASWGFLGALLGVTALLDELGAGWAVTEMCGKARPAAGGKVERVLKMKVASHPGRSGFDQSRL